MDRLKEAFLTTLKNKPDIVIDMAREGGSRTAIQVVVQKERGKMVIKGKLLSINAIAKRWKVSRKTVIDHWRNSSLLPAIRKTRTNQPRFAPDDAEKIFGAPLEE